MKQKEFNTFIGDTLDIYIHGVKIKILIASEKIFIMEDKGNRELVWLGEFDNKNNKIKPKNTIISITKGGL